MSAHPAEATAISRTRGPIPAIGTGGVVVWLAICIAWLAILFLDATGDAARLHHHALIEGGTPGWQAVLLFLAGWDIMLAAMMLPASVPAIRSAGIVTAGVDRPAVAALAGLLGFVGVWTAFGLAAFAGDAILHRIVDVTPWLAARPWLIEAGVLAIAGAWQFAPLKRRSLAACRHPNGGPAASGSTIRDAGTFGFDQGIACLGSSWALMFLMFGEGMASLPWMVGLTLVMVYEAVGRDGLRLGPIVGVLLILAAVATLSGVPL